MSEHDKLSLFVNAPPVAVFSVLADVKNRTVILSGVRKVRLSGPLPIDACSSFREWRRDSVRLSGIVFRLATFNPPREIALNQRGLVIEVNMPLRLEPDHDGTHLTGQVTVSSRLIPSPLLRLIERPVSRYWSRLFETDLMEIKKYVEQRANPVWRAGLRSKHDA
ncbi:SRPBCC family protein [Hoeflea sp. WL0058]|uniref:SRPBCC family protein n=1 Tax=Flavimaribacter sediminis TaxID=2865987 RepID=A0AAE3CZA4_9HYPH|nr:SRPBCC family protein [Flavimaribacter sediminis]MBW8637085.1 SRPBCC family protein [Flavimaribacter sediminis]